MLGDYDNMIVRDKTQDLVKLHGELESRPLSFRVVMQTRCRDGVMMDSVLYVLRVPSVLY